MRLSISTAARCFGSIAGAALLLPVIFSSCTIDAPEILDTAVSYEYVADPVYPADPAYPADSAACSCFLSEQISFTLTVNEPQGEKDIHEAVVYGPESLEWTVPFSAMRAEESGTYLRLTLPALVPPPGEELLPEGTYTIQLHDASGEIGEAEYAHVSISRAAGPVREKNQEQTSGMILSDRFPGLLPYDADELSEIPAEEKSRHLYLETPGFPLYIRTADRSGSVFSGYAVHDDIYPVTERGNGRFILHLPKQLRQQLADGDPKAEGIYVSVKDPLTGNYYTRGMFSFSNLLGEENQ